VEYNFNCIHWTIQHAKDIWSYFVVAWNLMDVVSRSCIAEAIKQ